MSRVCVSVELTQEREGQRDKVKEIRSERGQREKAREIRE